jgi:hypothetical protein
MLRRLAPCLLSAVALSAAGCSSSSSGTSASAATGTAGTTRGTTGNGTTTAGANTTTGTTSHTGGTINGTTTAGANTTTTGGANTTTTGGANTTGTSGGGTAFLCEFCNGNADCESGICDVADHVCQTNSCYPADGGDNDCANGVGSSCNTDGTCACPSLATLCGDCFSDGECASGHCDPNSGQCTTATCSAPSDITDCQAAGGTCTGASCACPAPKAFLCEACSVQSDCQSGICNTGVCQTSTCYAADGGDGDCTLTGGTCNPDGSCACAPPVTYPACFFCESDSDCQSGLYCDVDNNTCQVAGCSANATACTGQGYVCGGTADFPDGGANADACNCFVSQACGGCSANTDCVSGMCDTASGVCLVNDCSTNAAGCTALGYVCGGDGGADACNCALLATCDFCTTNADCASGVCDTSNQQCQLAPGTPCGENCTYWNGTCQGDGGCACP